MIAIYANFALKEENVAQFVEIAKELIEKTNKENGCFSYELIRSKKDANTFAFMERWENQECLNAHSKSEHFTTIVPKLGTLMEGKPELNSYEIIL